MSRRQRQWSMPRWSWGRHRIESALTFAILGITMSDFITPSFVFNSIRGNSTRISSIVPWCNASVTFTIPTVCLPTLALFLQVRPFSSVSKLLAAARLQLQRCACSQRSAWVRWYKRRMVSRSRIPSARFQAGPHLSALSKRPHFDNKWYLHLCVCLSVSHQGKRPPTSDCTHEMRGNRDHALHYCIGYG